MASIAKTAGTVGVVLALCGGVGTVAGCGGDGSSGAATHAAAMTASGGVAKGAVGDEQLRAAVPAAAPAALVTASTPSVIKTATIELRIARQAMGGKIDAARQIADATGGYVESSHEQSGRDGSATIVLRIPAGAFESAVQDLSQLGHVRSSTESGEDVSRQLVDLDARLVNLQAQRRILLGLMQKATTISGSILVENQLSQVQGQIEQLSGQLRYLHDRTDYGTVTLAMTTPAAAAAAPEHASALWQALSRSVDAAQSVMTAVIVGAGFVIPIALLVALAAVLARRFRPNLAVKGE